MARSIISLLLNNVYYVRGSKQHHYGSGDWTSLRLGAVQILPTADFWEVIVEGDLDVTVYSEMSGEGSTWTNINQLELSGDRTSLSVKSDEFESVR